MARGRVIPDSEYIALMDKGLTDREIAACYGKQACNIRKRLNRIRRDRKSAERRRAQLASIETYTLPPDEVKARYGACGEYVTERDFVHPEIETATRMRVLRGDTYI